MAVNRMCKVPVYCSGALILLLLVSLGTGTHAEYRVDTRDAARIVVLDEGRKKPLQSYAKKKLIQISGRSSIQGISALDWLLQLMITPERIDTMQCFRILNPETIDALGVRGPVKRRYSYNELYGSLQKCEQIANAASQKKMPELLPYERDVVQLWTNVKEYNSLASTFNAFKPSAAFTITDSTLASSLQLRYNIPYSFWDLMGVSALLSEHMKNIRNIDSLTSEESALVHLVKTMHDLSSQMQDLPPYLLTTNENGNEEWYSVWGYLDKYSHESMNDKRVHLFLQLRAAFADGDATGFSTAAKELSSEKFKDYPYPELEILYNSINPFLWAKILLALAGVIVLFAMIYNKQWIGFTSFALIGLGFSFQTLGLLLRVFILMRPPLASLYETFVVVSWIIVMFGIVLEIVQKQTIGKIIAAFGGLLFLIISGRYVVNGDSFGVIVAVLNSGFWLTIHIITISTGYAGFLISGLLGHIHLLQSFSRNNQKTTDSTYSAMYMFLLIGLGFTVAGTLLGGMWADQAWGRFWGWDPKENGALLIIIWGSLVVHARKGNLISKRLTSVFSVIGILVVMLAWIGVNMLGVGLHSYGFTYSGASLLVSVFVFECVFLISTSITHNIVKRGKSLEKKQTTHINAVVEKT